jgi:hypothetical protein
METVKTVSMPDVKVRSPRATTHTKLTRDLLAWITEEASYRPSKLHCVARLFGKNKLRERAEKIQTDQVQWAIGLVKSWYDDYHNGSLKSDKETSREQAYNQDFFIRILGYKEKPSRVARGTRTKK